MESAGFADACYSQDKTGYLTIRGVSDYCNWDKNDLWQDYAAIAAAAFTRVIIENIEGSFAHSDNYRYDKSRFNC